MTRSFDPEPISYDVIERILEPGLSSSSDGSSHRAEWLVISSDEDRRAFFEAACDVEFLAEPGTMRGLLQAPVVLVPVADPAAYVRRHAEADMTSSALFRLTGSSPSVPYWLVDAAFASMLVLLAAEDEGLGALFFRLHRPQHDLEERFAIPPGRVFIGAIALGGRASRDPGSGGSPAYRPRRPFGEVVHRGRW